MVTRILDSDNNTNTRQQMSDITSSEDNLTNNNASKREMVTNKTATSVATETTQVKSQIRRYYIDELGFYRHLDPEQRQYVCSNINAANLRGQTENHHQENNRNNRITLSGGDGGYEICFKAIRRDLGISHFDRIEDYKNWKRSWDDFMRIKLISQQPVTLNRELKARVRSGIPHDYRCKVWIALIRMRTKNIRAQFGEDIYQAIVRDFVSKVDVPDYSQDDDDDDDLNNNNNQSARKIRPNAAAGGGGGSSYIVGSSRLYSSTSIKPIDEDSNGQSSSRTLASVADENEPRQQPKRTTFVSQKPFVSQEPMIDKCFKQIELDLLRTLPNNRHFEDPNSRGVQRVRRVLRAYACFNQSVGYCQGMNRLAAMSLLVLPEEEAFWCLVAIIQCIMPKDYYLKPWLAQVDCCVLSDLLEKKMPKLHKHLVNNDIQLTLFTWFFTIFVDGFRPELMLRIWDCFLLEGDKVLFRFALAILFISQDDLLEMNDFSTMSAHLSRLVSTKNLDMEQLFETFNTMNPLSSGTLQSRRDFHRNRMQSMMDD